jgi:CheY-like chemotaxis protein
MSEPITILLVDDHALVREGARAFLEAQLDFVVVGSVGSGGEAVQGVRQSASSAHVEWDGEFPSPRTPEDVHRVSVLVAR